MEVSNYDLGYSEGHGSVMAGARDLPRTAIEFETLSEWDQYLDGWYSGQNAAYAQLDNE